MHNVVCLLAFASSSLRATAADASAVATLYAKNAKRGACNLGTWRITGTMSGHLHMRLSLAEWVPSGQLVVRFDVQDIKVVETFFSKPLAAVTGPNHTEIRLLLAQVAPPDKVLVLHLAHLRTESIYTARGLLRGGQSCRQACLSVACTSNTPVSLDLQSVPFCGSRGLCCSSMDEVLCGSSGCESEACCVLAPGLARMPTMIDCLPLAPADQYRWKSEQPSGRISSPTSDILFINVAMWSFLLVILCACIPLAVKYCTDNETLEEEKHFSNSESSSHEDKFHGATLDGLSSRALHTKFDPDDKPSSILDTPPRFQFHCMDQERKFNLPRSHRHFVNVSLRDSSAGQHSSCDNGSKDIRATIPCDEPYRVCTTRSLSPTYTELEVVHVGPSTKGHAPNRGSLVPMGRATPKLGRERSSESTSDITLCGIALDSAVAACPYDVNHI